MYKETQDKLLSYLTVIEQKWLSHWALTSQSQSEPSNYRDLGLKGFDSIYSYLLIYGHKTQKLEIEIKWESLSKTDFLHTYSNFG